MAISALGFLTGGNGPCDDSLSSDCFVYVFFSLATLSFGCLPIIFIGAGAWSAFKRRKHWIPAGSLVLGALVLQFLPLLNKSFKFRGDIFSEDLAQKAQSKLFGGKPFDNKTEMSEDNAILFFYDRISVLGGRVSVCVLMGCLLPGVALPLSTNLWSDMAALIISSSVSFFHIFYETYLIYLAYKATKTVDDYYIGKSVFVMGGWLNITILVSMAILVLLLVSAALASFSISQDTSRKIPALFSSQNFYAQFSWEKVEEQATKSLIVARTADPQYIMARSVLSSSIAFVITVCNGVLIFQVLHLENLKPGDFIDIWLMLRCVVIAMGSIVIYWRCITAVIYYPTCLRWKWSSVPQYFRIEDYWNSHLLDLIDRFDTYEEIGGSSLTKFMVRLIRIMRFQKLLYLLYWLQMSSILLSKVCRLSSELLFCNKYLRKLFIGSAYHEFSELHGNKSLAEIHLGKVSNYDKFCRALVIMQGESPAGIWIANKKSTEEIKELTKKGEEEGKKCTELVYMLKNNSSPEFSRERCVKLQNGLLDSLEVERELDVRKCSWKMIAVSIIVFIIELSSFTQNPAEVDPVIEACSQAWSMMDMVDISDGQGVELSKVANKHFQNLQNSRKWLHYALPINRPVERSPAAAKAAMQNLVERGMEIANDYKSRKWSEVIAGYSLYRLGANMNDQFNNNVGECLDGLRSMLADVMGSCTVKAVGVIMDDCKKQSTLYDEDSILKIAGVAGKVKGITENVGWKLKWMADEETQSIKTSLTIDEAPAIVKYSTFQMG